MSKSNASVESQEEKERKERRLLEQKQLAQRMKQINHKVLILSGKGGVGKSTVAVNLALSLINAGKRVGLLDIDLHGPSVPKLLNLAGYQLSGTEGNTIIPAAHKSGLKVVSIGFLLPEEDTAVIWRGPRKYHAIKQFLSDVEWRELDYLIVDSPPGTGDEPLAIAELIKNADGAVIVTTPQDVAITDVRKCVTFCRQIQVPVLGVLENMSGFVCPHCNEQVDIFKTGGGETMAKEMKVPFMGRIPFDTRIVESGDAGAPYLEQYADAEAAKRFKASIEPILMLDGDSENSENPEKQTSPATNDLFRIALPVTGGVLSMHFGHCDEFVLFDVDKEASRIVTQQSLTAPPHEPGVLPRWLHEQNTRLIIAGGMGVRAQQLFQQQGIEVLVGAQGGNPEEIVKAYLAGALQTGNNLCDH